MNAYPIVVTIEIQINKWSRYNVVVRHREKDEALPYLFSVYLNGDLQRQRECRSYDQALSHCASFMDSFTKR